MTSVDHEPCVPPKGERARLGAPGAVCAGFGLVALAHALVLGPRLSREVTVWFAAQALVAAQFLAVGLLCAALLAAGRRWLPGVPRRVGWVALAPLCVVLRFVFEEDASGPAERLSALVPEHFVYWAFGGVGALTLLLAFRVGSWCARPRWSSIALALALVLACVNAVVLPRAYPGVHLLAAFTAATLASSCLRGATWPRGLPPASLRAPRSLRHLGPALALVLGLSLTVPSYLVTPSNSVRLELVQQPAAVLVPFLAQLLPESRGPGAVLPEEKEWFSDRSARSPIPPSEPPVADLRLVLLLGVDSMRADILADESYREQLPELFALRDSGVWFTGARSAGASTAPSLTGLFSSRHYSQLYWSQHKRRKPEVFPHADPTPRFPELLSRAGVQTLTIDTAGWLMNTFGIVRGFAHEESARKGRGYPAAKTVTRKLLTQLEKLELGAPNRAFAFVHYLDPHAPYTSAGAANTPFEGYVKELALVDGAVSRLRRFLEKQKWDQHTAIVVFSDHGEAFGEHGLTWHGSTLYDSMIRVPLLLYVPGAPARRVDTAVTLLDIGPTLLDLFGQPTPGHAMGQSLLPFVRGQTPQLTRPVLAEAQLKRMLLTPQNLKVIHDTRGGTVELYDLNTDPGELDNLYSEDDHRSCELLGKLSAFFAVHTHQRPGYRVPYRKW